MINFIKKHIEIVGLLALIVLALVFSNTSVIEELKSMLRKKKVEEDVNKLKDLLKVPEAERAKSEQELVELAEKLKEDKKNLNKMSVEEVQDFYKRMLK